MWTDDGSDMLLYAKVAEPEFRIVTPRLAERVDGLAVELAGPRKDETKALGLMQADVVEIDQLDRWIQRSRQLFPQGVLGAVF